MHVGEIHMWQDMRKGTTSRIFRIIVLKRLYLWNHSSYELQIWHEYSYIILLHSQLRAPPTSGVGGASKRINRVRKSFYASLWQLAVRNRRLAVASKVGSVKQKAQTAYRPSGKPGALEALEWWQFEKWQKNAFCSKWSLFSYPTTYYSLLFYDWLLTGWLQSAVILILRCESKFCSIIICRCNPFCTPI